MSYRAGAGHMGPEVPAVVSGRMRILTTEAPEGIPAEVARDFFRSFVPEADPLAAVDEMDSLLKAF
jgi:hypothetical protein